MSKNIGAERRSKS